MMHNYYKERIARVGDYKGVAQGSFIVVTDSSLSYGGGTVDLYT